MRTNVFLVKTFTRDPEAGSPTGVMLDADSLSDAQMQRIATELNFAESAFVQSSDTADYRLRFFAPNQEVDLCGHATIASFHTLMEQGRIRMDSNLGKVALAQETRAGTLDVTYYADGRIVMKQKDPEFGTIEEDRERIAGMLGIAISDFIDDLPLQVVSTGTPKLLISLKDLSALRAVQPDLEEVKDYCNSTGARGVYPFTADRFVPEADFSARQFNPLADENEDPITSVAAGALGCYASSHGLLAGKQQFVVAQGYDLGMGGNMFVDVSDGVQVGETTDVYSDPAAALLLGHCCSRAGANEAVENN